MRIQEAIDIIDDVLYRETSKYPQINDKEAKSRLESAKTGLETIMGSSLEKGDLTVPQSLSKYLKNMDAVTLERATDIDSAVTAWRRDRDNRNERDGGADMKGKTKKQIRKNPFFWVVFCIFIAMIVFAFVAAFVPEERIPTWVTFLFSPIGMLGALLQLALALREWRSDMRHGEEGSKTQDGPSPDISIKKYTVNGNIYINKGLPVLAIVGIIVIGIVAIVVAMVFSVNGNKSSASSNANGTTNGSQYPESPSTGDTTGETPENPLLEYEGFDVTINDDGETVTVSISTQKEGPDIEFPRYVPINGAPYRVTAVGRAGLANNDKIRSVNLSTSVERIESGAFANFSALKEISIPDSVIYIGQDAFLGCTDLKDVNANSLESWYKIEFDGENSNPLSLNDDSVLTIGHKPITGEQTVKDVSVIPAYTFQNTTITQVTFENGVTEIGKNAFFNCIQLATVWNKSELNIEKGSTENGCAGFYAEHIYKVDLKTGRIATDDGYLFDESNGPSLVGYSGSAETLILPSTAPHGTAYEIAAGVFRGNASITSVTIPAGVTGFGNSAFYDCGSLTSVVIPDSVTSLGYSVFYGCPIEEATMPTGAISAIPKNNLQKVVLTSGEIAENAFRYCSTLTDVTFENAVTSIGDYAFGSCSSLTNIEIPDSVNSIGDYAFGFCNSLTSIEIPDSVNSIGERAFGGCSGLTSVTIGKGLIFIGEDAFLSCFKLIEVWDNSPLEIQKGSSENGGLGRYAKYIYTNNEKSKQILTDDGYIFYEDQEEIYLLEYTGKETRLTLPAASPSGKKYSIYKLAFKDSSLISVTISNGVTSIGDFALYNCSSLTTIVISDSVTSIGNYAFGGCSSLATIVIPNSVTLINNYAFCGCESLESIVIPDSVTYIGGYAFYGCSSLTIYCEAQKRPGSWWSSWNPDDRPVVWGYKAS